LARFTHSALDIIQMQLDRPRAVSTSMSTRRRAGITTARASWVADPITLPRRSQG